MRNVRTSRKREERAAEVPTQSFADIAFLLIIFFILATSLMKFEGFGTEVPAGEKSQARQEKTTTIAMQKGSITLNDEKVSLDVLRDRLLARELDKLAADDQEKIVLFEPLGENSWQDYFEVLAAITEAGGQVVVMTQEKEEKK